MVNCWGEQINPLFADIYGNPVERTPYSHPYNFDQFVVWTDKKFKPREIYDAVYSDRMMEWDLQKFSACCQRVFGDQRQYFDGRKPEDIEKFLIEYFGHDLKLMAIEKGCNVATGYPLWIFHYKTEE